MSKLTRQTQLIFALNAGANQIEQFGSLAGGTPNYTTNVTTIQALSAWLDGWFGGVVGSNLPAIEDLNAICYVYAYQLAYIFQAGVPEWDASTTYYTGSIVNSSGALFVSLVDNNLNHVVTDLTKWSPKGMTTQCFNGNGTFVVPPNVTNIIVFGQRKNSFSQCPQMYQLLYSDIYGNAYSCGLNSHGEVGDGTLTDRSSPVLVSGGLNFKQLMTFAVDDDFPSGTSTFGLTIQGNLYSWGTNNNGQLGLGDVTQRSVPVIVPGKIFSRIFVNESSGVFGLSPNGTLYAWGTNDPKGSLGVGDCLPHSTPTLVVGANKFGLVFTNNNQGNGLGATYALTLGGALWAWGSNNFGELGDGTVASKSSPVLVLGGLSFKKVVGSKAHNGNDSNSNNFTVGLTTAGQAYAWGCGDFGNIGNGTQGTNYSSPVAVVGGLTFSDIAVTHNGSVFGLTAAGVLYGWGYNADGELGLGDVTNRSSPVAVLGGLVFQKVDTTPMDGGVQTADSIYGLTTTGVLYGWGINSNGQLGLGDVVPRSSPVAVLGGLTFSDFKPVSPGIINSAIFAATPNGNIYAWGFNAHGELGLNNRTTVSSPVLVVGDNNIVNLRPTTQTTNISVTPGASYAITLAQPQATFGNTVIGTDLDSIIIQYQN